MGLTEVLSQPAVRSFVGTQEGKLRAVLRPFPADPPPQAHLFVLTFGGRAETHDAGTLDDLLHKNVLEGEPRWNYAVNLANLDYLSSTALRIFIDLDTYKAGFLHIAGAKEKLLRSLETVGLLPDAARGIVFHPTIAAALEASGVPPEAAQLCSTDELRVGKDARGSSKEVDLLKWASREGILGLQLAKELFQLERLYSEHFAQGPLVVVPSETKFSVVVFKHLKRCLAEAGIFREIRKDSRFLDEDDLEVVTKELLENAIDHGYRGKNHGLIALEGRQFPDRFELAFTDFGKGHSPGLLGRLVGRGGLGLIRLERMVAAGNPEGHRRALGILSPTSLDPGPIVELARRTFPDRSNWQIGPGTTILLTRHN